jgi:hypothetical protein
LKLAFEPEQHGVMKHTCSAGVVEGTVLHRYV